MRSSPKRADSSSLKVHMRGEPVRQFTAAFRLGRSPECEVCLPSGFVSRVHAEAVPQASGWLLRDLESSNGLYLDGQRVSELAITSTVAVRFGAEGPEVSLEFVPAAPSAPRSQPAGENTVVARYAQRYFRPGAASEPAGEHTMYVRRAFAQVQTRQRRRYFSALVVATVIALSAGLYALQLHREVTRQRALARDLFYSMKGLDVEIAALRAAVDQSHDARGAAILNTYEARREQMQHNYDAFLAKIHLSNPGKTEEERLIYRVARVFGECELDMPPNFVHEIQRYIRYWQSSGRFSRDIRLAEEKGYTKLIPQELLAHGLPSQFFYLAMQESDFDPYVSGPMTRMGIAKGMWQFIPDTAVKYGLHLGPLTDVRRPDPGDERDQFPKATRAAAEYLQTLYSTDGQGSGLLVMACYNWGEYQVLPLVRSMPPDPRERNFWHLLAEHRAQVPQETYDYVFYITAAAVIGENPRLFGFDFGNPLVEAEQAAAR